MDAQVLLGGACLAAGIACGIVASRTFVWGSGVLVRARAQADSFRGEDRSGVGGTGWALRIVGYVTRNGVPAFSWARRAVLSFPRARRRFEGVADIVSRSCGGASVEGVCEAFLLLLCMLGTVSLIAARSVIFTVCLCALAVACTFAAASRRRDAELQRMRELVPDALRCMEACFHAGLTVPQAFAEVARETKPPLRDAFSMVSHDMELGRSVDEALERFRRASSLPELSFVAMALDVQHACGGDASRIVQSAQESVERGIELRRSLRVQTAQAKLSAQVVSIMPIALLVVLSGIDPGFMDPFFESGAGIALLVCAAVMEIAGIAIVSRVLDVDIG